MSRERHNVHFTGKVQGVGFRYTTRNLAAGRAVTGYVHNLSDGRVQLVAEGEANELRSFVQAIADHFGDYIHEKLVDVTPANDEFDDFQIRF